MDLDERKVGWVPVRSNYDVTICFRVASRSGLKRSPPIVVGQGNETTAHYRQAGARPLIGCD